MSRKMLLSFLFFFQNGYTDFSNIFHCCSGEGEHQSSLMQDEVSVFFFYLSLKRLKRSFQFLNDFKQLGAWFGPDAF